MTNRQQPLSSKTLRAFAVGVAIFLAQFFAGTEALAKDQSPEQAAAQFYRWYMQSLAISQDPLRQSPVQMSAYVSPGLIGELKRRMKRKGLRADYFIQAQEFMDDWTTDIRVVKPKVQGNMATVVVVLGATEETRRRLALTLTRDGSNWKISTVRLV
ncbi:MAG: DUF3828 domain-containing protein [Telluria sp.]